MNNINRKQIIEYVFLFLVICLSIFQIFENLGDGVLKIWDESSPSVSAIEMMESGNPWVVTFQGKTDYVNKKPPLSIWAKVLSHKAFGINEFGVRFPSAFSAIITIIMVIGFSGYLFKSYYPGIIATIILSGCYGFNGWHIARTGETDAMLVLFIFSYIILWFLINTNEAFREPKHYILFGILVTLAAYTKGIAGLIPLAPAALYSLFWYRKQKKAFLNLNLLYSIGITLVSLLGYYLYRNHLNPSYTVAVLDKELGLVLKPSFDGIKHPEHDYYITYIFKRGLQEFSWFLPLGLLPLFLKSISSDIKKIHQFGMDCFTGFTHHILCCRY